MSTRSTQILVYKSHSQLKGNRLLGEVADSLLEERKYEKNTEYVAPERKRLLKDWQAPRDMGASVTGPIDGALME